MNTPRAKTLVGPTLLLGLALLGCQDRDFGLSIRQAQPLDVAACTFATDENEFQSAGIVDLALRNSYFIYPYIENNMLDIVEVKGFDDTDGRVNTADVSLRTATIEYTTLDTLSAQIQSPVVVPLSGTVGVAEFLIAGVEVLDSAVLSQLRNADEFLVIADDGSVEPVRTSVKIIARIRVAGETLDGKEVESNEFFFPIEVCNGCLISYPSNLLETRNGELTCPAVKLDADGMPILGPTATATCGPALGVDNGTVDCQTCQARAVNDFSRRLCQPPSGD